VSSAIRPSRIRDTNLHYSESPLHASSSAGASQSILVAWVSQRFPIHSP
jgi:hypothetical protein